MQVLIAKLVRLSFLTIAVIVALGAVGVDLSTFAIFSGAIGVGIGFGLQKIVANFISGVILLADKSVKPGDIVTVGDSLRPRGRDEHALHFGRRRRRPRVPDPQ